MGAALETTAAPLLLLVDDNVRSLNHRRDLFNDEGFATVAVEDEHQALREFVASPGVDVVITDVRLHPAMPLDKSGVRLARLLKEINADIPIVGYSAAFAENELTDEERGLFTSFYARGARTPGSFEAHRRMEGACNLFSYRTAAGGAVPFGRIPREVSPIEPRILHYAFPRSEPLGQAEGDISSVEDVLRKAGFELRFINPGTPRPTVTDSIARLQSPLPLWLHRDSDITIAEVYGYPEFYSYGDNEADAIANVLLLMDGFHRDFKLDMPNGTRNKQIGEFLNSIFQ